MQTVTLSESALAVLRLRAKGLRLPVTDRRLEAYRELADAGIMEADGQTFRFTEDGWARREELISAAEAHLRSLEPRLPERIELSRAAGRTLARHFAGDNEVTDANHDAYRELARAGIMVSAGTFIKGDDCVFQLAHQHHQDLSYGESNKAPATERGHAQRSSSPSSRKSKRNCQPSNICAIFAN